MLLTQYTLNQPCIIDYSYNISKYESGIIHLLINIKDKWIEYGNLNIGYDGSYIDLIGDFDDELIDYTLEIPYLTTDLLYKTVKTVVQEKDQINFYFIPYELITDNSKIIERVKQQREEKSNIS